MKTLAIETSCDDTSLAIVEYTWQYEVTKILAYSQINDHQKYGWVVPEVAYRLHNEKIIALIQEMWIQECMWVDSISVTTEPGLPWSLIVGKTTAAYLAHARNKPLIEINHIDGHIYSLWLERDTNEIMYPMIVLSASWWHNELYLLDWKNITKLGTTLDDAAWECFDKVARMLWWEYPWWPRISAQAMTWKPTPKPLFKSILLDAQHRYDFSFSGMKSQVYNLLAKNPDISISDICYEFQETMTDILATKALYAAKDHHAAMMWIVWWVSANRRLRDKLNLSTDLPCIKPTKMVYSTDNAAMIWCVGLLRSNGSV